VGLQGPAAHQPAAATPPSQISAMSSSAAGARSDARPRSPTAPPQLQLLVGVAPPHVPPAGNQQAEPGAGQPIAQVTVQGLAPPPGAIVSQVMAAQQMQAAMSQMAAAAAVPPAAASPDWTPAAAAEPAADELKPPHPRLPRPQLSRRLPFQRLVGQRRLPRRRVVAAPLLGENEEERGAAAEGPVAARRRLRSDPEDGREEPKARADRESRVARKRKGLTRPASLTGQAECQCLSKLPVIGSCRVWCHCQWQWTTEDYSRTGGS